MNAAITAHKQKGECGRGSGGQLFTDAFTKGTAAVQTERNIRTDAFCNIIKLVSAYAAEKLLHAVKHRRSIRTCAAETRFGRNTLFI